MKIFICSHLNSNLRKRETGYGLADGNSDGRIDFNEFRRMMEDENFHF